jgi:hypothetical protein
VDISDNEGVTPLKRARLLDRYSVIGYVLAAKAKPCANSGELERKTIDIYKIDVTYCFY